MKYFLFKSGNIWETDGKKERMIHCHNPNAKYTSTWDNIFITKDTRPLNGNIRKEITKEEALNIIFLAKL